nr:hypothetical protein [Tanacetum cinerariifolium]
MDMTTDQQVALDEALVPHASRLRIGKSNFHLRSYITSVSLKNIKSNKEVHPLGILKSRLRFVLDCVLLGSTAFCLQKSYVLLGSTAFCLQRSRVLLGSTAFCLFKRSCVLPQKHCVLSSKILHFVSETLRFVYFKDLAFCLSSTAFCLLQKAGSRDRPPMLTTGRYPQWRSRFLRYIDTRPNGDALRKCILSGPYKPITVLVKAVVATDDSPAIPEHTTEMWEVIKRLQQGESLKIQDVKTNLFWEFGKFTSHDEETMESYYTRFYKLMNEMIQNNLIVASMQVNVQFLQQLQPEWSSDPEQAQRDKDMQKNLALIAKYFKKIYKPTNNNLRTSSKSRTKNVDTTLWYKNDNQSGQFGNQRTVNVVGARENECRKPKNVKDFAYHKEKMLLCKQAEQGVPLQAEQYDCLVDTDEEIDKQELEAHYSYMAKIQEVPTADTGIDSEPLEQVQNDTEYNVFANDLQHSEQSESVSNTCIVETNDSNVTPDSPDMCDDDIQNDQNDVESDDERVALANLIANLKLDVDENKKIQKQLKKANTTLAQELNECKTILAETSKTLGEYNSVRDSYLVALQNK